MALRTSILTRVMVGAGMTMALLGVLAGAALALGGTSGSGAVSLAALNGAVTENYNTLASAGTSAALPTGWYLTETGTGAAADGSYIADAGSNSSGNGESLGPVATAERAFGFLASASNFATIGARFTNNTGVTVTQVAVSFTTETWRTSTTTTNAGTFAYSPTGPSVGIDLNSGTWTNFASLNMNAIPAVVANGAVDGNLAANQTVSSATITGLSIANGTDLWVRWSDTNDVGNDAGFGIDGFSITPQVPIELKEFTID